MMNDHMMICTSYLIPHLFRESLDQLGEEVDTLSLQLEVHLISDRIADKSDSSVHQAGKDWEQEVLVSRVVHSVHVADQGGEYAEYGEDARAGSGTECLSFEELDEAWEQNWSYCVHLRDSMFN